jgi:hypothetical protein
MGRAWAWVRRATAVLSVVLAGTATARAQTPTMTIADIRVVEGSGGGVADYQITVTLSAASAFPVDVSWSAVNGSAAGASTPGPGVDFINAGSFGSGAVHFDPGATSQPITIRVVKDDAIEWSPTLQLDEAFFVDLGPPVNATIRKGRGTVTLLDDDRSEPGLQFVSAVSDGTATAGRNRLQWRVPPAPVPPADILVAWNSGSSNCVPPVDAQPASAQGQRLISLDGLPVGAPGQTQIWAHLEEAVGVPLVPNKRYCYALFTVYSPGPTPTTERVTIQATPFDAGGFVKWSYATGSPDVVPPTVGTDAVYTVSTDGVVHAMGRGDLGGPWPTVWNPVALGKPAHNRSPIVPLPAGSRFFVGTESGEVHAVDGKNGASQLPHLGGVQATPAGLFKTWGGQNDMMLVGTNATAGANAFVALDPANGFTLPSYTSAAMGGVKGMAVVDYGGNRTFFLTSASSATLYSLGLGAPGAPSLTLSVLYPKAYGGASGSAVLRGDRLYFGTDDANLRALRLGDGALGTLGSGDGPVKGFVFPDRRNGNLYFSTNGKVQAFQDDLSPSGPALTALWSVNDIPNPSIVLHRPGTDLLYVGGGDGRLYEINVADADPQGTKKVVLLEAGAQIGAPSLDGPNNLVHVGSSTGVLYAVRVPF